MPGLSCCPKRVGHGRALDQDGPRCGLSRMPEAKSGHNRARALAVEKVAGLARDASHVCVNKSSRPPRTHIRNGILPLHWTYSTCPCKAWALSSKTQKGKANRSTEWYRLWPSQYRGRGKESWLGQSVAIPFAACAGRDWHLILCNIYSCINHHLRADLLISNG